MPPKECDPRCTGRCNKNKIVPVAATADKACDPRCGGLCNKKDAGTTMPCPTKEEPKGDSRSSGPQYFSPGQLSCIIMNLDGIILDIETVYEWVITDLVQKYSIPVADAQLIIDLQDEETATKLCSDYNLEISPRDFMIDFKNTSLKHLANTPLMPGIEALMKHFSSNSFPVAMATTSNEEAYRHKIQKHTKFFQQFCHIVLGGTDPSVTARKPSPILYQVCGSRFVSKPDPKTILVLEDSPEGVTAGKGAGMNVVWFPNKYMNKASAVGAVAVLNSIKEFDPKQFGLSN